jgi:hypothetical protein
VEENPVLLRSALAAWLRSEIPKWTKVARDSGAKAD